MFRWCLKADSRGINKGANMSRTTIESALRLLIHSRNSRGRLRAVIRAMIRMDCQLLRAAK